jgi:uncharacterized protein
LLRALLDANVLISAAIRPGGTPGLVVTSFVRHGTFALILSPSIIAEVEVALALPRIQRYLLEPDDARLWLADVVALADLTSETDRAKGTCRDPDDDVVLSAAIEGRASVLVTGDHDLLELERFEGISIITPRAFLGMIEG